MDDLGIVCGSTLYKAHSRLLLLNTEVDTKVTSWSMMTMMTKIRILMTFLRVVVMMMMMNIMTTIMMMLMLAMIVRSPGEKNFEKRDVFPTLADPRRSTLNTSKGPSPYLLLKDIMTIVFNELERYKLLKNFATPKFHSP